MPRRKHTRRRRRRKPYPPGKRSTWRKGYVPRTLRSGFPPSQVVKHRYIQYNSMDTIGPVAVLQKFRANSVFDPDFTGLGHQPMNRDLYASLYDHYIVLSAKITVKAYSAESLSNSPTLMYIELLDTNTSAATNYIEAMEGRQTKWRILNTRESTPTLSHTFSTKRFFGVTDVDDNTKRLGASKGDNPSEDAIFNIGVIPMDGANNADPVHILTTIEYIVKWSEPIPQVQS